MELEERRGDGTEPWVMGTRRECRRGEAAPNGAEVVTHLPAITQVLGWCRQWPEGSP